MLNKGSILGALSLLWAIGVGVWLATNDCMYEGVRTSHDASGREITTNICSSLVDQNGAGALVVLTFPVVFALMGLVAVRAGSRQIAWTSVLLLAAFCVLGMATVGLFYLPTLIALIVAATLMPKPEAESPPPLESG